MNVLVLNCGSSSLKFQIVQTDLKLIALNKDQVLTKGVIERIGSRSLVTMDAGGGHNQNARKKKGTPGIPNISKTEETR